MLVNALCIEVDGKVILEELRRKAYVDVSSLVVTGLNGSLVKVVSQADTERNHSAGIETDVMVSVDCKTVNLFLPVCVIDDTVKANEVSTL